MKAHSRRKAPDIGSVESFQWPAPPYFEFIADTEHPGPEECLLVFKDGEKASGRLVGFSPEEAQLKIRPGDTNTSVSVAFTSLLNVRLLQSRRVKRQGLPEQVGSLEVFAPSERQPFTVELLNGEKFQAETTGHVNALCGLFLFLPEDDGSVTRCFVPAAAMKSCSIGSPIGQILIEQKLASPEAVGEALTKQLMLRTQNLGEYLIHNKIVPPEQLAMALKRQRAQPEQKLGESLMDLGFLTKAELDEALKNEGNNRIMPLGKILLDMGILDSDAIKGAMASKLGIPFANLRGFKIRPDIISRIPAAVAHRHRVVPMCEAEGALVVALENPMGSAVLDEVRFIAGVKIIPVMASQEDITQALKTYYGPRELAGAAITTPGLKAGRKPGDGALGRSGPIDLGIEELSSRLASESGELDLNEEHAAEIDSTLVKLVNQIILDAVEQKASDIHIETNPGRKETRVRLRKDGTLVDYLEMPSKFRRAVISRIKIMSQLDITERRKPQDGKIEFSRFGPAAVELRVATIPTSNGLEDVVMRVLIAAKPVAIDKLGFDQDVLASIKRLISRPHGMFLVCGPTGSGKTTTLHSLLGFLNTSERKIWTAEDPIEITQAGLRQVQVNSKIGWTFAVAMRSFMRADPDVVMVGEMRDAETAKIGIEASLTGHLVLSTLHTNSAPESIVRLLDLGMDPFNFADALLGILAQRLARRLCESCKVAYVPDPQELDELLMEYCDETPIDPGKQMAIWTERYAGRGGTLSLCRPQGCEHCDHTGYKGRMGVYELLVADAAVKHLVQSRAPMIEVRKAGMAAGMRTLKQEGIVGVVQGLTDIHQVRAVCS